MFCVHELLTPISKEKARTANARDLETFMATVYPDARRSGNHLGWIAGPLVVAQPTSRLLAHVHLYIAKLSSATV